MTTYSTTCRHGEEGKLDSCTTVATKDGIVLREESYDFDEHGDRVGSSEFVFGESDGLHIAPGIPSRAIHVSDFHASVDEKGIISFDRSDLPSIIRSPTDGLVDVFQAEMSRAGLEYDYGEAVYRTGSVGDYDTGPIRIYSGCPGGDKDCMAQQFVNMINGDVTDVTAAWATGRSVVFITGKAPPAPEWHYPSAGQGVALGLLVVMLVLKRRVARWAQRLVLR